MIRLALVITALLEIAIKAERINLQTESKDMVTNRNDEKEEDKVNDIDEDEDGDDDDDGDDDNGISGKDDKRNGDLYPLLHDNKKRLLRFERAATQHAALTEEVVNKQGNDKGKHRSSKTKNMDNNGSGDGNDQSDYDDEDEGNDVQIFKPDNYFTIAANFFNLQNHPGIWHISYFGHGTHHPFKK
ncbi:unnamed protein product [Gongylonema pulchrum]|uniref:Secreted protein n=1 Tax=Gongylonema pulchrum TaxID=637853 RepID=A0A183CWE2_9BILA|nr:unnamed protein product [Gongylonema pulchrum]